MKPVDEKSYIYIYSSQEVNNKIPKFKICDIVKRSKTSIYKNVFAKAYTPSWSEEVFVIKKLKILFRGHMLLMVLIDKNLLY